MPATSDVKIAELHAHAITIPTDHPEADGTLEWDSTTIVIVEALGGGACGIGYTYADAATAVLIQHTLGPIVCGRDAMDISGRWNEMVRQTRNQGRPGIVSMAIAAVDTALWDLKARLLGVPLIKLLGQVRHGVPVYGSGGFTSYSLAQLEEQLGGWVRQGLRMVKMKVGAHPENDEERVRAARTAIGPYAELFVDANGAYSRKQALEYAERFKQYGVSWFEEPVSSDDLDGLRLLRDRGPAGMAIAAGEYGYDAAYFRRMLAAQAVDVLQADATRCAGITGFINAAEQCRAHGIPLSAHTAPSLHAHLGCALEPVVHLEYFHDHARIEEMLFDGVLRPQGGMLVPDVSQKGNGLELRRSELQRRSRVA